MTAERLRHMILRSIRNAVQLGWATELGRAARAFADRLRVRLLLLRVAA